MNFSEVFHPLFLIFYISLCISVIYIFKIYFLESENPSVVLIILSIVSFFISVWKFPRNLGDGLLAFAGYIALTCTPSSFIVIILSKLIAEFLIGARDFMGFSKRDPMEELEEQIEALIVAGKFEEAIQLLREKMKKNPRDYRYNSEIATISLMYLKDHKTALIEFQNVLKKTRVEEAVVFALYRMVDIYLLHLNEKEKAVACIKKILKNYPTSEYARSAQVRLEHMEADSEKEDEEREAPAGGDWRTGLPQKKKGEAYDMFCGQEEPPEQPEAETAADWRRGFIDEFESIGSDEKKEDEMIEKPSPKASPAPWTMDPGLKNKKYDDDDDF